jgi:hypothetical protein
MKFIKVPSLHNQKKKKSDTLLEKFRKFPLPNTEKLIMGKVHAGTCCGFNEHLVVSDSAKTAVFLVVTYSMELTNGIQRFCS